MRITVVLWTRALGDTLQLVPALRALQATDGFASIHLCGPAEPACLLLDAGLIDSYVSGDDYRLAPLATGTPSHDLLVALADPDLVIVFTSRTEEASGALSSIGVRHVVATPQASLGEHSAEHFVRCLAPLSLPNVWTGAGSVKPIVLPRLRPARSPQRALIHPGSGSNWKCPPVSLFEHVIEKLTGFGRDVAVLEGPADLDLVGGLGWVGEVVRPATSMELARELLRSAVVIGNDSGVTHLSGLLGIPTVAIFGPTHPDTWRPMGPRVQVVRTCTAFPADAMRVCEDPQCLKDITPEMVLDALENVERRANC